MEDTEAYSEPCQTSKIGCFTKIVEHSEYASELGSYFNQTH